MSLLRSMNIRGKDFFLIPNLLSMSRIFLAIPICLYLRQHNLWLAFAFIVIAVITDMLDGLTARHRGEITELGKILDPIADKILIGMNTLVIVQEYGLPVWLGAVIIIRDVGIIIGSLFISSRFKMIKPSNYIGKITVNVIAITLILHIFQINTLASVFSLISLVFILISIIKYGIETIQMLTKKSNKRIPNG